MKPFALPIFGLCSTFRLRMMPVQPHISTEAYRSQFFPAVQKKQLKKDVVG